MIRGRRQGIQVLYVPRGLDFLLLADSKNTVNCNYVIHDIYLNLPSKQNLTDVTNYIEQTDEEWHMIDVGSEEDLQSNMYKQTLHNGIKDQLP